MKILCTICARKGSKGLKNKNLLKINNKTLIQHTYEIAKKTKLFDKIIITTDYKNILTKYKFFDLSIKRPKKFANDKSSKIDAIKHALIVSENKFNCKFDYVVDLDVTAPLRLKIDIIKAFNKIHKNKFATNLVSGCNSKKNPFFNQVEFSNNILKLVKSSKKKIIRRQDTPRVYDLNASIYIWRRKYLLDKVRLINKKTIFFEMPYSRSIDIDSFLDLEINNFIKRKKYHEKNF